MKRNRSAVLTALLAIACPLLVASAGVAWARANTVLDWLKGSVVRPWVGGRSLPIPVIIDHTDNTKMNSPAELAALGPDIKEEYQWAAVRFPIKHDFKLTDIYYYDANAQSEVLKCTSNKDREVQVFVVQDKTPPATPVPVVSYLVPGEQSLFGSVPKHIVVAEDVSAPAGSQLYVAFNFPGTSPNDVMCLTSWGNAPAEQQETDFWSAAVDPPFPWKGLEQGYGLTYQPFVSIGGAYTF